MANCAQCGRKLPPLTFGKKICQWCVQHERAQRGELDDEMPQPVIAAPWVRRRESNISLTHILFGANVAVFIAMVAASGSALDFPGQVMLHFGANVGPFTLSGQWWRLVTYMFLHGGIMHIAFNMWCLWDLGALCESLYGRWTYAAIYLLTGVSGGLASIAWNPRVLSVGASGAIFGLAGALIASFYLGEFSLPGIALKGTLRSLLFFAGFNLFFGAVFPGIDNSCHIGGLVSGLILGALVARIAPQADDPLRRAAVLGVVALALLGAAFGVRQWRGAPFRMARAFQSLSEDGPDRAIANLQALVKEQPNFADARYALAHAYFNQEKYPQSEAEFKRVLDLNPQYKDARFNLGLVYLSEKRLDDAKAAFTQAIATDASDANAHYGLGLVLADAQNYQAAIEEFKKAVALGPQVSGVYTELGNAYANLKMCDQAIAAYVESREKDGDNPDVETGLADCYRAKGMTRQAQAARDKAAQLGGQQHN